MGMTANLLMVSPDELDEIRANPEALEELLEDDAAGGLRVSNIDKSWGGLLFLLTGKGAAGLEEPETKLSRVLFSGQYIDPEQDLGYGPAHYLDPAQVAQAAKELAAIDPADLEARFDPAEMMRQEIYPTIWDRVDEDLIGYLMEYFDEVKLQYQKAAENGYAMITFPG